MTAHTPGPWAVEANSAHGISFSIVEHKRLVARFVSATDARLIAAAPDLLDLVRNVAGLDDHVVTYGDMRTLRDLIIEWRDAARAAIAKAEGVS